MLFKVIIFGLFGFIIYLFFTGKIGFFAKSKNKKIDSTNMIECETCGAYVSEKDAVVTYGNHHYCSKACKENKA